MVDKKISELDPGVTVTDADLLAVVQNDTGLKTLKVLMSSMFTYMKGKLQSSVNVYTKNQSTVITALTDGATIATDASLADSFRVTLGGDRTLANPTSLTDGMTLGWVLKQDATGSRLVTFGAKFVWMGAGTPPVLQTAPGAVDYIVAIYVAAEDKLYASAAGVGSGGGGGAVSLGGLTDVDLTTPPTAGQVLTYDDGSSTWKPGTPAGGVGAESYDVSYSTPITGDAVKLINYIPGIALTLPVDCAGSTAIADVAATAATVFSIQKEGVEVATITFAISGTVGTFSTQAAVSFLATDKLTLVGPTTADATLADIGVLLHLEVV